MVESLVVSYGYVAVFLGALLEGETFLIAAGFAAHRGLLDFRLVVALAAAGATLGDQLALLVGRWWGQRLLARFPGILRRQSRLRALQDRYASLVVVILRFMYGFRLAGPIVLGANGLDPVRFFLLNCVSAWLWAIVFATLGYLFGATLEALMSDVKQIEETVLLAILLVGSLFWCLHRVARRCS